MLCSGVVVCVPVRARADVTACIDSHASGQREAKAGHLRHASELFESCASSEGCPTPIREECYELYREAERNVPTVIFAAVDEQGNDLTGVRVSSGDEVLAESLDGRAMALDPGSYVFDFVGPDGSTFRTEVLVREGEKNRVVVVRLGHRGAPQAAAGRASGGAHPADQPPTVEPRRLPVGFWVASGVGVATLASWGVFAALGRGHESTLDECSPDCPASQHDDFDAMRRNYLIADISLGLAAVSTGTAVWLYFRGRRTEEGAGRSRRSASATRWSLGPLPTAPGINLVVTSDTL